MVIPKESADDIVSNTIQATPHPIVVEEQRKDASINRPSPMADIICQEKVNNVAGSLSNYYLDEELLIGEIPMEIQVVAGDLFNGKPVADLQIVEYQNERGNIDQFDESALAIMSPIRDETTDDEGIIDAGSGERSSKKSELKKTRGRGRPPKKGGRRK